MTQPNVETPAEQPRRSWRDRFGSRTTAWRDRLTHRQVATTSAMSGPFGSFLATFVLVLGGCSVMTVAHPEVVGIGIFSGISIAVAFGLSLFVGQLVGGPGSQANPAETLGMSLRGHQPRRMLWHIPAQFAGAIVASILVWMMYGHPAVLYPKLGAALPDPTADWLLILLVELVGAYLLVRISAKLLEASTISYVMIAAASGAMLTVGVFFALMVTGGSFNPARSFGPAFVASIGPAQAEQAFTFIWAYLIGQTIGGLLGAGTRPRPKSI